MIRATSDLHLTESTAGLVFAALDEVMADAREHGGVTVLCGDILDQPELVHAASLVRLRRMLNQWPGPVYVIAGNHDQYDGANTVLDVLNGGSCTVVASPCSTSVGLMIPYVPAPKFFAAIDHAKIGRMPGQPEGVVWCHAGFRGAYRNAMSRDRDGVPSSELPEGWLFVSGHYHCPQNLGPVLYCGSPYQTSFAEEGHEKGWLRWENIADEMIPERIAYAFDAPRYRTVRWDPEAGDPVPPADLRPGDRVRVVTTATRKVAVAHAAKLASAGLAGASLVAAPDSSIGRGVVDGSIDPSAAAAHYATAVMGPDRRVYPDPRDMDEFANDWGLWG